MCYHFVMCCNSDIVIRRIIPPPPKRLDKVLNLPYTNSMEIDLEFEMTVINSATYMPSIRRYLSMPKDMGFNYMEVILDEMVESESITWSEAYEFFASLVDRAIMEKY